MNFDSLRRYKTFVLLFPSDATAPSWPWPPPWGSAITLRHTPSRTALGVGTARRRELTNNTQHSKETDSHTLVGFEPTCPVRERPQTHACAATGIRPFVFHRVPEYLSHTARMELSGVQKSWGSDCHSFLVINSILLQCKQLHSQCKSEIV
jgi:hypothetical protein